MYTPPARGNIAAISAYVSAPASANRPPVSHASRRRVGDGKAAAMMPVVKKIPEPTMPPITRSVALGRPRARSSEGGAMRTRRGDYTGRRPDSGCTRRDDALQLAAMRRPVHPLVSAAAVLVLAGGLIQNVASQGQRGGGTPAPRARSVTLGDLTAFDVKDNVATANAGPDAVRIIFYRDDLFRLWLGPDGQ